MPAGALYPRTAKASGKLSMLSNRDIFAVQVEFLARVRHGGSYESQHAGLITHSTLNRDGMSMALSDIVSRPVVLLLSFLRHFVQNVARDVNITM